jgi:putative DNA methylase
MALVAFSDLVAEARRKVLADMAACDWLPDDDRPLAEGGIGPQAYADAVGTVPGVCSGQERRLLV